MTTKKLERLGTKKLSGEVSTTSKRYYDMYNEFINDLNKICHRMIDILNDREIKKLEEVDYINELGFLAEAHLISPLFYLCELSRLLNKKEWENVGKFCKVYQQY